MPKTIDGVEVSEGMTVYKTTWATETPITMTIVAGEPLFMGSRSGYTPQECYASRELVLVAQATVRRNRKRQDIKDAIHSYRARIARDQKRIAKLEAKLAALDAEEA